MLADAAGPMQGAGADPEGAGSEGVGARPAGARGLCAGAVIGIACALILLGFWFIVHTDLARDRDRAAAEARRETMALAQLAEAHAEAIFRRVEGRLRLLRHHLQSNGGRFDWGGFLAEHAAAGDRPLLDIAHYGPDGLLLHWTGPARDARPSIAEEAEFASFGTSPGPDGILIGLPYRGASGHTRIPVYLRVTDPGGGPAGAVVAELSSHSLRDLYAGVDLPAGGSIALTRADGPLLARQALHEDVVGRTFARSAIWPELAKRPVGHYEAASSIDGVERLFAYRSSRVYPLIVALGIPTDHVYGTLGHQRALVLALGAAFSLLVVGAAVLLWRIERRREREIAARREAEAALAVSRRRLREAIEAVPDAFLLFDAGGRLLLCNERTREFYPRIAGMLRPGVTFAEIVHASVGAGQIADAVARPEAWIAERLSVLKDLQAEAALHRTAEGRVLRAAERRTSDGGFVSVRTDVTELKRREEALEESRAELIHARDEADRASRAKSQFLAMMSHELRTPLNAVIGFAETLEAGFFGALTGKQREYVGDIRRSGEHLLSLINDILDLSKVEAGSVTLAPVPLDAATLAGSCLALIDGIALQNGVRLRVELPDPPPPLVADERAAKQMLVNLLSNAVKFTPRGGEALLSFEAPPGGGAAVVVRDTGIGMDARDIATALEPFGQVDNQFTRSRQGTGLGLPLVRRLVEMHGGTLRIESIPGAGTTVRLEFPEPPSGQT